MIDYEVYGYLIGRGGQEHQRFTVCYTLPDARQEAKRMAKDGYEDVRIVKHAEDDEAVAFWDMIGNKLVRTE